MKIAICDDDLVLNRKLHQFIFETYHDIDLRIDEYRSGEEFLQKISTSKLTYDLLLLDIEMDKVNGITVAKELKQLSPKTFVVFITSHDEFATVGYEVSAFRYVLSTPTVPAFLTGREFLKFFLDINEANISNLKTVDEYFEEIAINVADRDKLLKDYSHGMKNKMQMLVNMIVCPPVLLLDEPLTALDVVVAEEMKQLLRTLKQHSIIILSTHIMDLALNLCDEIVLLNHGLLEHLEFSDLNGEAFKERIISALREGTE